MLMPRVGIWPAVLFASALLPIATPCGGVGTTEIRIEEITGAAEESATPIPWIEEGVSGWLEGPATFDLVHDEAELSAKGWLATTDEDLLIHVEVRNTVHLPAPTLSALWEKDGIEIGLDLWGDATGRSDPRTAGVMGPDDVKLMAADTVEGASLWCYQSVREEISDRWPEELCSVTRDEERKTTLYEVSIPWSRLSSAPGLFPAFGMAIQINDHTVAGDERAMLQWGAGVVDIETELFNRCAVRGAPAGEYSASVVQNDLIWDANDAGRIVMAFRTLSPVQIEAELGESSHAEQLEGSDAFRRYEITFHPGATDRDLIPFSAKLQSGSGLTESAKSELLLPAALLDRLTTRLSDLALSAEHPILRRHFLSIKGMVEREWARATVIALSNFALVQETVRHMQRIDEAIHGDAAEWSSYLEGGLPLYMAFISQRDSTLQYYAFTLPKDWDPDREYPLYFELHGAGNDHPLNGFASGLTEPQRTDGEAARRPGSYASVVRTGYHVRPFGRGNSGYVDIGEIDVLEAYDDVHELVKIDPDRRYLYGFSMGGGGTWSVGTRTPDRWAALAIHAPGVRAVSRNKGLGQNIAHLPVFLFCGKEDFLYRDALYIERELRSFGCEPVVTYEDGLPHNYTAESQKAAYEYMTQFTRKRPEKFSYVSVSDDHRGTWGIMMKRDERISGLPRFTCAIDGNQVEVESVGTPGLRIDLGKDGLGLSGNVAVTWNGNTVYEGPAQTVELGDAPAMRPW